VRLLGIVRYLSVFWLTLLGVLQEQSIATLDVLQQHPELLLLLTRTLVKAAVAAAVAAATHTAHAAGVAEEKARAAAALG